MAKVDERVLIEAGYWRFSPAGIPIPGFTREFEVRLLPEWRNRPNADMLIRFASFALEAEHRRQAITSQQQLDEVWEHIHSAGYDFAPAQAIAIGYKAAHDAIFDERLELLESYRQRYDSEAKLTKELAEKQLPSGRTENLAIIRTTLKKFSS